jgi:hypothetical protein
MAEGVLQLAIPVAPELVGERHCDRSAGIHGALPPGISIIDLKMDRHAHGRRRCAAAPELREVVGEQQRVAIDAEARMHDPLAVLTISPVFLGGAEGAGIEFDRRLAAFDREVRVDANRNGGCRFSHRFSPSERLCSGHE